jgi:hypothetical protein
VTARRLVVALAAMAPPWVAGCVAPPSPPPAVHECESEASGGERVASYTAAGGAALRLAAGTPALLLPRPAFVAEATAVASAPTLWLRVAGDGRDDVSCELGVRGGTREHRAVAPTGHRERFEWRPLAPPAGAFDRGAARDAAGLPIELRVAGDGELRLDQFAWGSGDAPPAAAASPPVWRDGQLELRAGFDAKVADPEWALHLLREQYTAVARLCGRELDGPVVLVALSSAQWPGDATGAFQNGCAIFLRERELHLPWRSFAHEIAHLFEEQGAVRLPRFWSEGFACAVADEVEASLYERGVPRARVRWRRLLAEGDELYTPGLGPGRGPGPGAGEMNRAIAWPAAAAGDRRDYEWAGALVDALAQAGGAGFFARLERELLAPPDGLAAALAAARDEPERVALAAAPFLAAAGEPGAAILASAGIPFRGAPGGGERRDAPRQ